MHFGICVSSYMTRPPANESGRLWIVVPARSPWVMSSTAPYTRVLCCPMQFFLRKLTARSASLRWTVLRLSKSSVRSVHVAHPYGTAFTTCALNGQILRPSRVFWPIVELGAMHPEARPRSAGAAFDLERNIRVCAERTIEGRRARPSAFKIGLPPRSPLPSLGSWAVSTGALTLFFSAIPFVRTPNGLPLPHPSFF